MNQPQNLGKDLFGFELKYQNLVSNGKESPKYNGNISQMDWKTRSNNEELRRYTYQYDDLNRLTKSFYSKPLAVQPNTGSYDEYLSYDVNGNIKTLSRFGDMDKPQAVKIDELSYTYIGNQLVKVSAQKRQDGLCVSTEKLYIQRHILHLSFRLALRYFIF